MSGYCRSTVFSLIIILALCVTAASAATLNTNLVYSKVTQTLQIPATIVPVYAICPAGYDCMTDADATAQLGTYTKYSDAVCGYKQSTATLAAVVRIPEYCVKNVETPTPAVCPAGCSCMVESAAKDKFGVYTRCSDSPCASAVTGAAQINAYCFRQGTITTTPTPAQICPAGCSCISEATAKAKGGSWSRCSADICGYEQSTATLAAAVQVPKYCMKQQETTPVCPEGCTCLSDANAKARYGTYTRCTADVCGYEQSTQTTAVVQIPEYCVKQGTTPVCPDGCACISDEDAKLKGLTERCDNSQTPCGYRSVDATANTAANRIPLYCYNVTITTTPTPQVCPQGCYCLQEAEAKLKFGPNNYTRCSENVCGYDQSATSANGIPKYCFKPTVTFTPIPAVCPQGCVCTTDAVAKEKGLTACRGTRTSCGYDENKQPLYCFEQVPSPTCVYDYQKNVCAGTCQQGYTCGLLASEKDATGKVTYAVCGCTGQPTTACAYDYQKNACTGTCPNQQSCAIVGKDVNEKTGEVKVICGCPQPTSGQCTFDKEKQACTGTCDNGAACAVIGKKTDDKTGEVYTFCGCPQPSSCSYDYSKEACVGTCTVTGDVCQLNTIYRDPTTGKVTYAECHCKGGEVTETCAFTADNYCVGTCARGGQCANTSVVDASGKMTFICTCAGGSNCVLSANNECSGTCVTGAPCTRTVTKDNSGQEKVSCVCGGISQAGGTPVGIFEAIGRFFHSLFGGK